MICTSWVACGQGSMYLHIYQIYLYIRVLTLCCLFSCCHYLDIADLVTQTRLSVQNVQRQREVAANLNVRVSHRRRLFAYSATRHAPRE